MDEKNNGRALVEKLVNEARERMGNPTYYENFKHYCNKFGINPDVEAAFRLRGDVMALIKDNLCSLEDAKPTLDKIDKEIHRYDPDTPDPLQELREWAKWLPWGGRDNKDQPLDIRYTGTTARVPSWTVLMLAAPAPQAVGQIKLPDSTKRLMNADAHWGLILKVGERAWDRMEGEFPYKAGQWVHFEDFHPTGRRQNSELIYFIPDTRIVCEMDEPFTFEPWLNLCLQLEDMAKVAAAKREEFISRAHELMRVSKARLINS